MGVIQCRDSAHAREYFIAAGSSATDLATDGGDALFYCTANRRPEAPVRWCSGSAVAIGVAAFTVSSSPLTMSFNLSPRPDFFGPGRLRYR